MAAGFEVKLAAPISSMMLLTMTALLPAVLTRMPKSWLGLVSENPSMVTFAAWIVISAAGAPVPVMVDSTNGVAKVRPATGFPAWAPLRMRDLGIITFSG